MHVDAFGKIENSINVKISEANTEKDLSAVTYDNFSNNRGRYGGNRDRDNRSQFTHDTQSVGTFLSSQI
jgi:hypothetical protein